MYHHYFQLPPIMEVIDDLSNFEHILAEKHLFYPAKHLITSPQLYEGFKSKLHAITNLTVTLLEHASIEDIPRVSGNRPKSNALIIGFGGGRIIDFTKYYASQANLAYIALPSTLSHDGIFSQAAVLHHRNSSKKLRIDIQPPLGVIVDIDVAQQSPDVQILSGIGDLISNINALDDWKLASHKTGETINSFAYTLAHLAAHSLVNYKQYEIKKDKYLRKLAYGLIISGMAMTIAGSSRPASGSEHAISHAIDELYPEKSTFHGIQVAYGCLLVAKRYRPNRLQLYKDYFSHVGLLKVIQEWMPFTENQVDQILHHALVIRDRYTILNQKVM